MSINTSNSETYGVDINNPEFNESGENEVFAISDASQALQIARRLLRDDWYRDFRRARVLSAFNGSAPYSDDELKAIGQSYRYNVSFGYMEGVVGRAVVPFNQLSGNVENIAAVQAELPDAKLSVIQDEFVEQVKQWGKWQKFSSRLNQELVLNGYTTAVFPSEYHPFPVFIPQKDAFVNEGTPNDVSDLEVFVWRKQYLIHELYKKIIDPEAAAAAGWDVENVRKALENAIPNDIWRRNTQQSGTWTAVQSAIRDGSLFNSIVGAKVVDTFHVFASELEGEVSHWVVVDTPNRGDEPIVDPGLFKKLKRWKSFREMLVYFDLEPGDGKWQGSRGLGQRAFNIHEAIDKVNCTILDQAFTSGLTLLQTGDQTSNEEFNLVVTGPFAVIPPGVTVQSTQLPAIANTTFQATSLLTATGEQRIGDIVPNANNNFGTGKKTATQSSIDANRSMLIQKDNIQRYIDPLSQLLSIMLRRMANVNSEDPYAKSFVEHVKAKGITEEDLKKIRSVRSTGRIDDVLGETKQTNQTLLATFRGDPDINQVELKRRVIASEAGPQDVDELLITKEDQTLVINAIQKQLNEIGTMINQVAVPVSPQDDHLIHLQTLIKWIDGQLGAIAQGQPSASIQSLILSVQHGDQHLGMLKADKTKEATGKQIEPTWNQIKDGVKGLIQHAQQQAQAQARASAMQAPHPSLGMPTPQPSLPAPPAGTAVSLPAGNLPQPQTTPTT